MSLAVGNLALSPEQQQWLADLLTRFEQSWRDGLLAAWTASLPPPGTPLHRVALLGLARIDLALQWRNGRRAVVEAYLQQFPELGSPETVPFQLIEEEHRQRQKQGAPADRELYLRRFPSRQTELASLFPEVTKAPPPGAARAPSAELAGQFGRYRIQKKIGQGGQGSVYLAHDTQLDRAVAIKVPRFEKGELEKMRQRFLREARAAATLSHPNICPVFDVGEINGIPYVTMGFIEGRSLQEILRAARGLSQKAVAAVARKLARALALAHEKGVVHQDLKPGNVMITPKNEPIIMDFGLARRLDRAEAQLTGAGVVVGTPAYMAPEQLSGNAADVGPACDIYSLGVMVYEMLTGRQPFKGSAGDVFSQVLSQPPRPVAELRPDVDPALALVCQRAMAKSPAERFSSMKEFADALTTYLHDLGRTMSVAAGPAGDDALEPLDTGRRRFRLRRLWVLAGAGALAALLAAFLLWPPGGRQKEKTASVQLLGIAHLNDRSVTFTLDGQERTRDELRGRLELSLGDHELIARRDGQLLEGRRFQVDADTNGKMIPMPEEDEPGALTDEVLRYEEHDGPIHGVWFLPDGRPMSSHIDAKGGKALVWNPRRRKVEAAVELPRQDPDTPRALVQAAFTPAGRYALFGGMNVQAGGERDGPGLVLWNLQTGKPEKQTSLPGPATAFARLCWSRNARWAVADLGEPVVWDVENATEVGRLRGTLVSISPDGGRIVTADASGFLEWDRDDIQGAARRVEVDPVPWLVPGFTGSSDGRLAFYSDNDEGRSHLFDVTAGSRVHSFPGYPAGQNAVAFSLDGRRVLVGGADRVLRLWDCQTGKELCKFTGHTESITAVALSPGGRRALSGSEDRTVRLWRLPP